MPELKDNKDWNTEQHAHEIRRLEAILRNPKATKNDREIATSQLNYWRNRNHD
jgi:hypothetical protein